LKEKTGKTLEQWVAVAKKSGATKHGEMVGILKRDHGLTHGYASLVVRTALVGLPNPSGEGGDGLVDGQYRGDKAALRPIYDKLLKAVKAFGGDVEVAPKQAYVSLRRGTQFALIQPSTKARMDVGIKLKGVKPQGRLEASGSFNQMVSHRVRIESTAQVDAQLIGWLKQAYNAA
jgi:predicted transport protein